MRIMQGGAEQTIAYRFTGRQGLQFPCLPAPASSPFRLFPCTALLGEHRIRLDHIIVRVGLG